MATEPRRLVYPLPQALVITTSLLPPRSCRLPAEYNKTSRTTWKTEEEQTLRFPPALLCSLPQASPSLGFEEGQAGIPILVPPLLTGAPHLISLESHSTHFWKWR